jgi:hypothetical protein
MFGAEPIPNSRMVFTSTVYINYVTGMYVRASIGQASKLRAIRPQNWVRFPARALIIPFATVTIPALGPTKFPQQNVPWALSQGIKQSGRAANY